MNPPPTAARLEAAGKKKPPAVPAGMIEIRPCPGCGLRLAAPEPDQGKVYACPACGLTFRALSAAGPFSTPSSKSPPESKPGAAVPELDLGRLDAPPPADPTPLVSSVGVLNLGVAGFCTWLAVLAWGFGRTDTPPVWGGLAAAFAVVGLAVFARARWAWPAAVFAGAVGVGLAAYSLVNRGGPGVMAFGGYAVYALAVLFLPGTRREFAADSRR